MLTTDNRESSLVGGALEIVIWPLTTGGCVVVDLWRCSTEWLAVVEVDIVESKRWRESGYE